LQKTADVLSVVGDDFQEAGPEASSAVVALAQVVGLLLTLDKTASDEEGQGDYWLEKSDPQLEYS
jgi:hypothetical protein